MDTDVLNEEVARLATFVAGSLFDGVLMMTVSIT